MRRMSGRLVAVRGAVRHAAAVPAHRQEPPSQPHEEKRGEKLVWQTHHEWDEERYGPDVREAHELLGTRTNDPLSRIKLKYLLLCRRHHPEVGGDPSRFYKITLAYEQIMADRGVECRGGNIVFSDTVAPRRKMLPAAAGTEPRMIEERTDVSPLLAAALYEAEVEEATRLLGGGTAAPTSPSASAPRAEDVPTAVATTPEDANRPTPRAVIRPPETAVFEQQALVAKLDDAALQSLWNVAPDELTHDEEEAVAREMIERAINSGRELTAQEEEFMMTHLIERSESVAAEAARSATDVMHNTEEKKELQREGLVLAVVAMCLAVIAATLAVAYARYRKLQAKNGGKSMAYLNAETMLPWWGNDEDYERTVKRLFLEEWRRARSKAQQQATFNIGLERENRSADEKRIEEAAVFDVSPERLAQLRQQVHDIRADRGTPVQA